MGKQVANNKLDMPIDYQTVSSKKGSRSLSFRLKYDSDREANRIRQILCHSRCEIEITVDGEAQKDSAGQDQKLIDTAAFKVKNVVDIHRLSFGESDVTGVFSFNRESVADGKLDPFAFEKGRMIAARVGEAGEDAEAANEAA